MQVFSKFQARYVFGTYLLQGTVSGAQIVLTHWCSTSFPGSPLFPFPGDPLNEVDKFYECRRKASPRTGTIS